MKDRPVVFRNMADFDRTADATRRVEGLLRSPTPVSAPVFGHVAPATVVYVRVTSNSSGAKDAGAYPGVLLRPKPERADHPDERWYPVDDEDLCRIVFLSGETPDEETVHAGRVVGLHFRPGFEGGEPTPSGFPLVLVAAGGGCCEEEEPEEPEPIPYGSGSGDGGGCDDCGWVQSLTQKTDLVVSLAGRTGACLSVTPDQDEVWLRYESGAGTWAAADREYRVAGFDLTGRTLRPRVFVDHAARLAMLLTTAGEDVVYRLTPLCCVDGCYEFAFGPRTGPNGSAWYCTGPADCSGSWVVFRVCVDCGRSGSGSGDQPDEPAYSGSGSGDDQSGSGSGRGADEPVYGPWSGTFQSGEGLGSGDDQVGPSGTFGPSGSGSAGGSGYSGDDDQSGSGSGSGDDQSGSGSGSGDDDQSGSGSGSGSGDQSGSGSGSGDQSGSGSGSGSGQGGRQGTCCPGVLIPDVLYASLSGGNGTITLTWNGTHWYGCGVLLCGKTLCLRFSTSCGLEWTCNGGNTWNPGLAVVPFGCDLDTELVRFLVDVDDFDGGCPPPPSCGVLTVIITG